MYAVDSKSDKRRRQESTWFKLSNKLYINSSLTNLLGKINTKNMRYRMRVMVVNL